MTGILLGTFFAASALIGVAVIHAGLRRHLAAFGIVRRNLRGSPDLREFRYSLRTIEVRSLGATVYRPDFKGSRAEQPLRAAA